MCYKRDIFQHKNVKSSLFLKIQKKLLDICEVGIRNLAVRKTK